jgi:hypothetical protein
MHRRQRLQGMIVNYESDSKYQSRIFPPNRPPRKPQSLLTFSKTHRKIRFRKTHNLWEVGSQCDAVTASARKRQIR